MTGWQVYLFTRLDSICFILSFVFLISIAAICFTGLIYILNALDDKNEGITTTTYKFLKGAVIALIITCILGCVVPNMKEAAAIYLIPKLTTGETVEKIPRLTADLLEAKLKEWIKDSLSESE